MFKTLCLKLEEQQRRSKEYFAARKALDKKYGRYVPVWARFIISASTCAIVALTLVLVFPAMALFYNETAMPTEDEYKIKSDQAHERLSNLQECIDFIDNNQKEEADRCLSDGLEDRTLFLSDLIYVAEAKKLARQEGLNELELASEQRFKQLEAIVDAVHSYPILQSLISRDMSISKFKESTFYRLLAYIDDSEESRSHYSVDDIVDYIDDVKKEF